MVCGGGVGLCALCSAIFLIAVWRIYVRSDDLCGIPTFAPTTRKRGGLEVRERSMVGYPREGITVRKGLEKREGSRGR